MSAAVVTAIASNTARTFPELLTAPEVAAVFRVDIRTVERWASEGRLRAIRPSPRTTRFRADEVEALLSPTKNELSPAGEPGSAKTSVAALREGADVAHQGF